MYYNMSINEAQVVNTWGQKIKENLHIEDPQKIAWMSRYAFNHTIYDKKNRINESVDGHVHLNPNMNLGGMGDIRFPGKSDNRYTTNPAIQGSGDNVYSVLPLAMQVAAQTFALDLVPVIPIQGPHNLLQYLDFVYEGGRLHNQGGWETTTPNSYNDEVEHTPFGQNTASPYMIKGMITLEEPNSESSASVSSDPMQGDGYHWVPEKYYAFVVAGSTSLSTDEGDYRLQFIYPGRIDGMPLFRVLEKAHNGHFMLGGEGASKPIYEYFDGVREGTYDIVAIDDATASTSTGEWVGDGYVMNIKKGPDGKRMCGRPELVRAFEDHVTSFSGEGFVNGQVTSQNPYTREMGEATPGRNIGLRSYTLSVEAETLKVNSAITREQVQDMKQFGIDALAQAEAALTNELTQGINKNIIDRMFVLGARNACQVAEVEHRNDCTQWWVSQAEYDRLTNGGTMPETSIWLGTEYRRNNVEHPIQPGKRYMVDGVKPIVVNGGGEVMGTIQRRVMSKILAASNIIAVRGRRGQGTFAVVSGTVGTALMDIAGFLPYPLSNTINQNGNSLYPIGSLSGISIYVDPNMAFADYRVLVGRKGKESEPGIVFMPYLMADKVETTSPYTFAPAISLQSRFVVAEAGIHPQLSYYTFALKLDGVSLV